MEFWTIRSLAAHGRSETRSASPSSGPANTSPSRTRSPRPSTALELMHFSRGGAESPSPRNCPAPGAAEVTDRWPAAAPRRPAEPYPLARPIGRLRRLRRADVLLGGTPSLPQLAATVRQFVLEPRPSLGRFVAGAGLLLAGRRSKRQARSAAGYGWPRMGGA